MFKKLSAVLFLSVLVLAGTGLFMASQAATSDTFQVSFVCSRIVDVTISTDNVSTASYEPRIDFGAVNTSAQVIASTCVFVHNTSLATSAAIQNYSIYISTTSGATYSINTGSFSGGEDSFAVAAVFRPSYPIAGNFNSSGGTDDVLGTSASPTAWNATHLNPSTNPYTGTPSTDANVGAHARGDTSARLWLSVQTPTAVSTTGNQVIGLTLIAQ